MGFQGHPASLGCVYLGMSYSYISVKSSVDSYRLRDILSAFLSINTCHYCKCKIKFQVTVKQKYQKPYLAGTLGKKLAGGQSLSFWAVVSMEEEIRDGMRTQTN